MKNFSKFLESRKPHAYIGLYINPGKTGEGHDLSPLVNPEALLKQEEKAKAEL